MKILLCHDFYRQPGGERAAVEQLRHLLTTRGHEVVEYTRDNREIDGWKLADKVRFPATALWSQRTVVEVRDILRRERPDVAHVHNVFPLLSPSLYRALAKEGVPIVQTVHNFRFLCPNGLFFTHGHVCRLCRFGNTLHAVRFACYRDSRTLSGIYAASIGLHRKLGTFSKVDRFLPVTRFMAEELVAAGIAPPERMSVVPNFVPTPLPLLEDPAVDPPYALFLGRLTHEKGADLLIEAFAGLREHRLVVAGEGPERADLDRSVRERGLDNVRFAGFVTGETKRRLLARAWVTVVPSRWYEGFPFAVLESFGHGVPAVVSGHGSLAGIVEDDRHGRWFRPEDADDLRDRLRVSLGDPEVRRRWSREARRAVETLYSEQTAYDALIRAYQDVRR